MKTHVIITGHARTFARCWPNIRWNAIKRLPNPHFHVSVEQDNAANNMVATLEKEYPTRHQFVQQPEHFPDYGNAHLHAPYALSVPVTSVLGQLWHLQTGWELAKPEAEQGDMVVRLRPDLWFHERIDDPQWISDIARPWWGNFGGINDRFAVMRDHAAPHYFGAYGRIPEFIAEGCPLHPESIMARATITCVVEKANYLFSTIRENGQQRWPEILPGETP